MILIKDSKRKISIETVINNELEKIRSWLKTNNLSLNVKKTKYMIFYTAQRKVNTLNLKINNTIIERVTQLDCLGISLNENLSWKDHIKKISNRISQILGILNKLKHSLPITAKTLIYSSLIRFHLTFIILVSCHTCERFTKFLKKCIRTIITSKYNAHTEPIFN